jgi:hypothetical protein
MAITYSLNQTGPLAIKGMPASGYTLSTLEGAISPSSSSVVVGGTALKITGSAGGEPLFDKAAATDAIIGFAKFDPINNFGTAGARAGKQVTVLVEGSTMVMEVGATAVSAGDKVEIVATGDLVIPSLGTNTIVGTALIGGATGSLIPVAIKIETPIPA